MLANPANYSPSACSSGISFASGPPTPLPPTKSQHLYRYEELGMLIFDSHARLPDEKDEEVPLQPRTLSQADRKELDFALESDRQQFQSTPLYPAYRYRPVSFTLYIPDDCLRFSSHFEGGNLQKVVKVSEFEYHLTLEADTGSQGHMQWYYFSVANMREGQKVKFCIMNLTKPESLYQLGMQPLVRSRIKEVQTHQKWLRAGTEVTYQANLSQRLDKPSYFRTLSFLYQFEFANDLVYFAHCYPYGLTDLQRDLAVVEATAPEKIFRIESLCETTAGNVCPLLTITSKVSEVPFWEPEKKTPGRRLRLSRDSKCQKKCIMLTARVHPGESNSSFVLKGAIDFLLSQQKEAQILRKAFIFRIVPMLNPDGVVYGNTRCDLVGIDLNRRWNCPNRLIHPTVYHAKKLLKMGENDTLLFCDFHGHSRKKNVFIYGCCDADSKKNAFIKLIPLALQETNKLFSFPDCHFRIEKEKESTARVVSFREANVLNSYTLEASFFGPSSVTEEPYMTQTHFASVGRDLCKTLLMLVSPKRFRRKLAEIGAAQKSRSTEGDLKTNTEAGIEVRSFSIDAVLAEIGDSDLPSEVILTPAEVCCESSSDEEVKATPLVSSPSKARASLRPETAKSRAKNVFQRPKTSARKREDAGVSIGLSAELIQQQVSRIYTMLKYYKEAGGRLNSRESAGRHLQHEAGCLRRPYIPQIRVRPTPRSLCPRPRSIMRSPQVPKSVKDSPVQLSQLLDHSRRSTQTRSWFRV